MARYYFDICQGDDVIQDDEGHEVGNPQALRAEAVSAARELMAIRILEGHGPNGRIIRVRNAQGVVVFELPLRDAIDWG